MAVEYDKRKLQQMIREMPEALSRAVRETAFETLGEVVSSFNTGAPGRTYELYNPRRTHTASAPGGPPAVDTGALRASYNVSEVNRFLYRIQDGVEYGIYLEFGTEKMAARPHLRPALEKVPASLRGEVEKAIKR